MKDIYDYIVACAKRWESTGCCHNPALREAFKSLSQRHSTYETVESWVERTFSAKDLICVAQGRTEDTGYDEIPF